MSMAAKPQPEARSLSDINLLAANPPQYPHHPDLRESLTLYISRVPGKQDIILSTFRPQKKSVTAEDVTNALYYIHLNTPEDEMLVSQQRPTSVKSPRSSFESSRSVIPRKPLPESARVSGVAARSGGGDASSVARTSVPPLSRPPQPNAQSQSTPSPIGAPVGSGELSVGGYQENPMFRRRPSGARYDAPALSPSPSILSTSPPPSLSPINRYSDVRTSTDTRPVTPNYLESQGITSPNRPNTTGLSPATSSPSKLNNHQFPSPSRTGQRPSSVSFSLTIIRRDPTSNTQCNVGKVWSFQTNVPTPENATPNLDPQNMGELQAPKIDIRIETSGYAKYRDMPTPASVEAFRAAGVDLLRQHPLQVAADGSNEVTIPALKPKLLLKPVGREEGFSRQVLMSYGPSWRSSFMKAFHRRDGSVGVPIGSPLEDSSGPKSFHIRHGSASTIMSIDSIDGSASAPLITEPGPGLKPKGYVFVSPWGGRCEFRTSSNGRSLKCRHILDTAANSKLDPRELAHHIRDAQAMGRSRGDELSSALLGAKLVSELRFNLPSKSHQRTSSRDIGAIKTNQLSEQFSKLLHQKPRAHADTDDEWDDDDDYDDNGDSAGLDLSLGREHAGGGSRGRRAKLGKLIIHDEGLKMLDLVVAANIGVWWTSWERTF